MVPDGRFMNEPFGYILTRRLELPVVLFVSDKVMVELAGKTKSEPGVYVMGKV